MDVELTALAATGATTVVGLMVTETWNRARDRLVRLFSRGGDEEAAGEELQDSRDQLLGARDAEDESAAADIEAALRVWLRRVLQRDADAVGQLRDLIAEFGPERPVDGAVNNTAHVGVQNGPMVQARDISGLTIHGSTPSRSPRPERP
ncbi:hypothetical protein [Streptomyces boluensis]|uniref:Uncharacterized protein n=1 Tax=Streptomyces boluensis TaxID=1775135 RepID=A0A964XQ92_9ACTN|nr:hypothetical protein [Streptomyces boluensis]NBE55582.1 hypothetical protein [Streptomyces boluensis]